MRRTATISLHWLSFVLLILLVAGGPIPAIGWAFVLSSLLMCAVAAVRGLMSGPGPKLEGTLRAAHPWLSRAMYVALGFVALVTGWQLAGGEWSGPPLVNLHFYLLSASSLHAIFHLWRHTALGDGALRRITPKSMHSVL
ncbi:hypothetical protein [uncultured Tateyamaria sp.]|uniref:hypothetical protein n=1 Tax=uncultured Tateyamaria sp. TaxID=455651 RepID=UPI00261FA7C4|nr:hypothetical protein [uncultured Tateyamaria sp.]